MRTLYLQRMPSLIGREAFSGRKLFDQFKAVSEESLLSFAVIDDEEAQKTHPNAKSDFLSLMHFVRFDPDVIYIEGGLFYRYGDDWRWRIPRPLLEKCVMQSSVVLVADIDRNKLREEKALYLEAGDFLGTYAQYSVSHLGEVDSDHPVYGIDETHNWKGSSQNIICKPERMLISDWIRPIYEGISEILIIQPCLLTFMETIIASANCSTTATLHLDRWVDKPYCCPFAVAKQRRNGYVVTIAAHVSGDLLAERCPDNTRWLTNLAEFLVSQATDDKRRRVSRYTSPYKLFLSHRSVNKQTVREISQELNRRGIDFWLDEEHIVASDSLVEAITRGLAEMTHFVLFWSKDCIDAPWVRRELNAAVMKLVENEIPIFIVRLDTTNVPEIIRDLLWIDAVNITPKIVGGKIADAIETLAKRPGNSGE